MDAAALVTLGSTSVPVSRLSLVGTPFDDVYDVVPDEQAVMTVHAAFARGVRYFDTAPLYASTRPRPSSAASPAATSGWTSTASVGRRQRRDELVGALAGFVEAGLVDSVFAGPPVDAARPVGHRRPAAGGGRRAHR